MAIRQWRIEHIEDTTRVIRSRKSKRDRQTTQWPKEKGQNIIYKTLSRKLEIEQHEQTKNRGRTRIPRKGEQFLPHMSHP